MLSVSIPVEVASLADWRLRCRQVPRRCSCYCTHAHTHETTTLICFDLHCCLRLSRWRRRIFRFCSNFLPIGYSFSYLSLLRSYVHVFVRPHLGDIFVPWTKLARTFFSCEGFFRVLGKCMCLFVSPRNSIKTCMRVECEFVTTSRHRNHCNMSRTNHCHLTHRNNKTRAVRERRPSPRWIRSGSG